MSTEIRGNIHIVKLDLTVNDYPSIFHTFKNATKEELPLLMKDFPNDRFIEEIGGDAWSLFHLLLEKHRNKLKEKEMYKDVFEKMAKHEDRDDWYQSEEYSYWYENTKVSPELITNLYTNILGYKELIDDINEVLKGCVTVCFESEDTWKFVNKLVSHKLNVFSFIDWQQ